MNEHITKKSFEELSTLAKPLQDWMMANFDMNCKIEIDNDGAKVFRETIGSPVGVKTSKNISETNIKLAYREKDSFKIIEEIMTPKEFKSFMIGCYEAISIVDINEI